MEVRFEAKKVKFRTFKYYCADTFWIRVRRLGACVGREIQQFAVLSYNKGENKVKLSFPSKKTLFYSQNFFTNDTVSFSFDRKFKIIWLSFLFLLVVEPPPQKVQFCRSKKLLHHRSVILHPRNRNHGSFDS